MKIYNKKLFVFGIFSIALATLNFIMDVINKTSDVNGAILVGALYLIGFEAMLHSLSRKLSKQDKLENLDERNQLIALKSKSKAFTLSQGISFCLMLAMLLIGKVSGYEGLIFVAIGLAFTFPIMMLTELFTYMHYEDRN